MTSAHEIALKLVATDKIVARISRRLEIEMKDLIVYGLHVAVGRNVCARRARKLRRRGEDVRRSGFTTTGKTRYTWMKRIPPIEVMLP